ncbi:MAG: hypothetical protein AAGG08_14675, partial [Actinomycetota bacterium]
MHPRPVVAIRSEGHTRRRSGDLGQQLVGHEFERRHDEITIDGALSIEEAPEVLDVADADHPSLELLVGEGAGRDESLPERCVTDAFGHVRLTTVDVHPHAGAEREHQFTGERPLCRGAQRPTHGLGCVRACGGVLGQGHVRCERGLLVHSIGDIGKVVERREEFVSHRHSPTATRSSSASLASSR